MTSIVTAAPIGDNLSIFMPPEPVSPPMMDELNENEPLLFEAPGPSVVSVVRLGPPDSGMFRVRLDRFIAIDHDRPGLTMQCVGMPDFAIRTVGWNDGSISEDQVQIEMSPDGSARVNVNLASPAEAPRYAQMSLDDLRAFARSQMARRGPPSDN